MKEQNYEQERYDEILRSHEIKIAVLEQALQFLKNDISRLERSIEKLENKNWTK